MIKTGNIVELVGESMVFHATPVLKIYKGKKGLVVEAGSERCVGEMIDRKRVSVLRKDLRFLSGRELFSFLQDLVEDLAGKIAI